MQGDLDDLARSVRQRRAILFVGAGVSMVVGLPSWQALIDHMMEELEIPEASRGRPGLDHPILAEYYRLRRGTIGPLRSWMDREWKVSEERVRESRIHELIVSLDFPLIYTTNYDRNLEVAFELAQKPFHKISNARDLTQADRAGTQIVKFHGDFDDDSSLVLTEADYFARLNFDSPLDVKFRADAMSRTLLFIGYSMSDLNIRLLLYRIWETWSRSAYERNRPAQLRLPAPREPGAGGGPELLGHHRAVLEVPDPEEALTDFLERLHGRWTTCPRRPDHEEAPRRRRTGKA
jgi:hypothetical protein